MVVKAHLEPNRHPPPLGSVAIDHEAILGPPLHSGTNPGSWGNNGHGNNKSTCCYYKQAGHFILSCLKLKQDMRAKVVGQF